MGIFSVHDGSDHPRDSMAGFLSKPASDRFLDRIFYRPPAGIPDIVAQPLASFPCGVNVFEKPAGIVAGVQMYDYRFSLPVPFNAGANHTYAITILAYQPGLPDWGMQASTAGGSHSVFRGSTNYMTDSNLGGGVGLGPSVFTTPCRIQISTWH